MKLHKRHLLALLLIANLLATPACSLFGKSEYATLTGADLTTLVDNLPDMQRRTLAQNENQRKQLVEQFKKAFSLAQAAEAEGLHKTERFKLRRVISEDQLLAAEFSKRNPDFTVTREELNAYYETNKAAFDADFALITRGAQQQATDEQKEMLKLQWAEMKVRASKGRQAGLQKEPSYKAQMKFNLANVLANYYSELLEEKFKPSAEEKSKYIAEHPEADLDKLKAKAQGLLDRVKKGDSFEQIADEFNEDGTRGRGGDLDWFPKGRMDPDFEKAAFALGKGQTTQELIKSSFGFHIIRVDDKRPMKPTATPTPGGPSVTPAAPTEPEYEIRARHIYVSTQEAESFEGRMVQEKVKRAMEDATLKFPVNAPTDFTVNVQGLNMNRMPGAGAGESGTMRPPNPNENR